MIQTLGGGLLYQVWRSKGRLIAEAKRRRQAWFEITCGVIVGLLVIWWRLW